LQLAEALLSTPTAPFREHWMLQCLDGILEGMRGIQVRHDKWGNRLATVGDIFAPGATVFVAHLDHPGFVFDAEPRGTEVQALFEGRVFDEYFAGARVRFFRDRDDAGTGATIREFSERRDRQNNRVVLLEADEPLNGAVLGMWDVPAFSLHNGIIRGRACDDLCGVAATLAALEQWGLDARNQAATRPVGALFTRAEEAGFCGALACLTDEESRALLPPDALYVSVEISKAGPMAPLGGGAILRLGDKAGLFDARGYSALSRALDAVATDGGTRPLRRAMMDGGTCEATAFAALGLRAAGMCAPVLHYHNMDAENLRIAPEQVSIDDLRDLATAIHAAGTSAPAPSGEAALRTQMEKLAAHGRARLTQSSLPTPAIP